MRRRLARPYGHTVPPTRMLSLLMGLAVLGILYQRVKEPQFWRWMTNESRADGVADISEKQTPPKSSVALKANDENSKQAVNQENLVLGPNETDEEELAKLRSNLKAVQDRQALQEFDMPAYWQLMRRSRTRPIAELEKLARRDVPYSHLWEEPDLYRGQPIRLKLHIRRVLKYEPSKNPQDLKMVYEAWGWTEDSRSFPFCVVFPEKPEGLPIGTDVDADFVFVGYFLKWMSYQAFDVKKNAPLLVGRLRPATKMVGSAKSSDWETAFLTLVGGVLLLSFLGWFAVYGLRRPRTIVAATTAVPDQLPDNWLAGTADDSRSEPTAERLNFETVTPPNAVAITSPPTVAAPATMPESAPQGVS